MTKTNHIAILFFLIRSVVHRGQLKDELRGLRDTSQSLEQGLSVSRLSNTSPPTQRCSLFGLDHPSTAAQLLRFWLYFMSPNCDWPGPLLASFHLGRERAALGRRLGHLGRSTRPSADLHLHGTVRDTSQVHPPLGWHGSQLTSTCPPGPSSPFTPRPPAFTWDYLTYPAELLLQLFNKTWPLFTKFRG